jgi:hypothetical protein
MKTLPTYRQITVILDEDDDDNSFLETKTFPLKHAAAIELFAREFALKATATRIAAIESFVFCASGGLERSDTNLVGNEMQARFPAPEGSTLIATSGECGTSTHWHLSQDGGTLTLTTAPSGYFRELRTVEMAPAQSEELLQTLASPYLKGNEGNPVKFPRTINWDARRLQVSHKAVAEFADKLGVDLATKPPTANGWAVVERGALADTSVSGLAYPGLKANFVQLCVSSAFRPGIQDDLTLPREGLPANGEIGLLGIADLGEERNALTKRILKNEAEPFITHFRRVDRGSQALAIEQAYAGSAWHATLFTEVMGVVVVKAASLGNKELLTERMLAVADQLLSLHVPVAA